MRYITTIVYNFLDEERKVDIYLSKDGKVGSYTYTGSAAKSKSINDNFMFFHAHRNAKEKKLIENELKKYLFKQELKKVLT